MMDNNMLTLFITKGLLRKYNENVAGFYSNDDFLEDLLYGIFVLDKIIHDKTLVGQFKYMARDFIDKFSKGFVRAYLLDNLDDIDFDVFTIKEKVWFLLLYEDVDLGVIGNIKKKLILDDVKQWFKEMYMEVKWDESEEFVEVLTLMSFVKSLEDLPIKDMMVSILTLLYHKYDGKKPNWPLYWLTGNIKYIRDADVFDRRAWVFRKIE